MTSAAPARGLALRLLVLNVSESCDQRCAHCQIWQGPAADAGPALSLSERLAIVEDALAAGLREALLTGGEPLLSPDLWPIAARLRGAGVRTMLATNGRLLEPYAMKVASLFDEIYVSLDGGPETHDRLRGTPSFERVIRGIAALRRCAANVSQATSARRPLVIARTTLHAANLLEFEAIVKAARSAGFDHLSFLPVDLSSSAFGGRPEARHSLRPTIEQIAAFEAAVGAIGAQGGFDDGFVRESPEKLRRIAGHLRASAGAGAFNPPPCDAPWWSSVVEADGRVRPCFFHDAVGDVRDGLIGLRASQQYRDALANIAQPNPTCARCVCPKKLLATSSRT